MTHYHYNQLKLLIRLSIKLLRALMNGISLDFRRSQSLQQMAKTFEQIFNQVHINPFIQVSELKQ